MLVQKQETAVGVVQLVTFRQEDEEDEATFKAAVKTWLDAEGSITTRDQIIDKATNVEAGRITVSLV